MGTTAPGSRLAVSGGAAIGSSYAGTASPTDGAIIQGNTGIGTTAPTNKLYVYGDSLGAYLTTIKNTASAGNNNGLNIIAGTNSSDYSLRVNDSGGSTDNMYVRGDGYGYLRAAAWVYGSDRRMKENIASLDGGLEKISQLKPVRFDYINGIKNNLGFIAQDVQRVIPEAVSVSDPKTGMLGLKTDFIIPYLVNAIKEQQQEIEELRREIKGLKKE